MILVSLSTCKSSALFRKAFRYFDNVLLFAILAAEMGIFLVKSDRSRTALAERTMGGLNMDNSSDDAVELRTFLESICECEDVGSFCPLGLTDLHCFCYC